MMILMVGVIFALKQWGDELRYLLPLLKGKLSKLVPENNDKKLTNNNTARVHVCETSSLQA